MSSDLVKCSFAMHEVVVLTGFSKHMLDYLVRDEIFVPSLGEGARRRGVRRRYTFEEVVLLRALNRICAGKGKIRHLRRALSALRQKLGPIRPGQRVEKQLFVQGDELCLYTPAEGGMQLRSGQMTFSFVVDLSSVTQDLADCIEFDESARTYRLVAAAALEAEAERLRIWGGVAANRAVRANREAA